MKYLVGGLVGWYVASAFICMPQSTVSGMSYPCGEIKQLAGPLSVQGAAGAAAGALLVSVLFE